MSKTVPVSVRLEAALNDQVAAIAAALDRPKSWVIEQSVQDFVTVQDWQLAAIDEGIEAADAEMRIVWTEPALRDLAVVWTTIARDNPLAADRQVARVLVGSDPTNS